MKTSEINKSLIGKKVSVVNTGMRINGIIVDIYEDETHKGVRVEHEPVVWGEDVYTTLLSTATKKDLWYRGAEEGNLKNTRLI